MILYRNWPPPPAESAGRRSRSVGRRRATLPVHHPQVTPGGFGDVDHVARLAPGQLLRRPHLGLGAGVVVAHHPVERLLEGGALRPSPALDQRGAWRDSPAMERGIGRMLWKSRATVACRCGGGKAEMRRR